MWPPWAGGFANRRFSPPRRPRRAAPTEAFLFGLTGRARPSPPFDRQSFLAGGGEGGRITIFFAQRPAVPGSVVVGAVVELQCRVCASQLDHARHRLAVRVLEIGSIGGEE